MFVKNSALFPIKDEFSFIAHCVISPLYGKAAERAASLLYRHSREGLLLADDYMEILETLRRGKSGKP